jgi:hypothetical protein
VTSRKTVELTRCLSSADQQSRRDLGTNFSGLIEHFALIETGRFPLVVGCASLSGRSMAKAYSVDMRQRVIDRVESGASQGEAAEHYQVCPSTAVTP